MNIKSLLFGSAMVLITTSVMADVPMGGSPAISAPTPSFPVGYQCNTNWPFSSNQVSCVNNDLVSNASSKRFTGHTVSVDACGNRTVSNTRE